MRYLILTSLALFMATAQAQQKPAMIVDTDAGTDDLMAISYLLSSNEVNLKAVTVVNGLAHVEQGAKNILRLLELAGRRDIPVFVGEDHPLAGAAAFPEEWRQLSDNPPAVQLPQNSRQPETQSAVEFLAQQLRPSAGGAGLRILALGPLTNIAKAITSESRHMGGVRELVIMGGAISVPGNLAGGGVFKTDNRVAEWNIYIDPLAAHQVFASNLPIELVPLDATNKVLIDMGFVREFSNKVTTPLGRAIAQILSSEQALIEQNEFYAWDPLAAVAVMHPGILSFQDTHVQIELKPPHAGRTTARADLPRNARVAMDADRAAFLRLFTSAFYRRTVRTR